LFATLPKKWVKARFRGGGGRASGNAPGEPALKILAVDGHDGDRKNLMGGERLGRRLISRSHFIVVAAHHWVLAINPRLLKHTATKHAYSNSRSCDAAAFDVEAVANG
jgi:hypothetical protein